LSEDAAGFVLAGGESRRMGRDKALVELAGCPLIEHALGILHEAGLTASIAGSRARLEKFAPMIEDPEPGLGPLAGICAALASAAARYSVFLSIDAPLIPSSLVAHLLHHARVTGQAVTLASVSGFAQTFPAVLDRAILPALLIELAAGRRGCYAAFETAAAAAGQIVSIVAAELLAQCGQAERKDALPPARWFLNVNTPGDLEQVRRILARCRAM